ncbi:MAG: imidazolonepropionase [Bacteroidetes bacterium]|jgi:imidazolonepropionase|nr:imidazolonepropionase [Bacteroidota bacterium]MBT3748372.1 imidazolonepropionase [Bacteroidota bacterium]MBT4401418.1 imidazolonepropionase [Bacteroidota bacterium]MBT4410395.1 imidazolonepropionase [Bacteroidota bacterium]MBT5427824.1 imidazolonepropionase [Bacteroidota bacterium]
MDLIIKNIKTLVQIDESHRPYVAGKEMANLNTLPDAWLAITGGKISSYGSMSECPETDSPVLDASGKLLMPAFCDSHTHLVYAGSREIEYIDKIRGLSYEEIAKRGGGINNSARLLRNSTEEDLFEQAMKRINEIISKGTGAVEIKSGYGLETGAELKMLRVIRKIKESSPITVKSTFLGAHSVPLEYKGRQSEYVDLLISDMLPKVADEGLADYVDVFCDRGFFTVDETDRILEAAAKYGITPKIHANELDYSGGIQVGVKHGARSVDHLEFTGEDEIEVLRDSGTMPTLLPGAAFFLGMDWAPARKIIDSGLPLALASDYNPGSSPSGDMKFIMSLACITMRMLPEEAIHATTINSAYAMGVENELGTITIGKKANLILTKEITGLEFLPYAYTTNLIDKVILNGKII